MKYIILFYIILWNIELKKVRSVIWNVCQVSDVDQCAVLQSWWISSQLMVLPFDWFGANGQCINWSAMLR